MTTPEFPAIWTPTVDPSERLKTGEQTARGQVFLVGAGPGEPGAITLRALECLAQADAVLFDYLVNPSLLRWATRPNVRLISLGGHGDPKLSGANRTSDLGTPQRMMSQAEICQMMVELANQGQNVVRLKCGDPLIFARASEELDAVQNAGLPCEVVPGITSAFAAGSYAGIPLTNREHASAVALVTGHPAAEKPLAAGEPEMPANRAPSLDWEALAKFPGTLVVYMGTTQLEYWVGELLRFGKDPQTPVAILRRCGFTDQSMVRTTLANLIEVATTPKRIRPPVVFLIGSAIASPQASDWFSRRPLRGQTILVTRPNEGGAGVLRDLELLGAQALHWPAISIRPLDDYRELDQAIEGLYKFRWVVFPSSNGVRALMQRLWSLGRDARALANCHLAAVGAQTAKELERFHLRADLVPARFDADHLADDLVRDVGSGSCLIVRASRGREVLADRLRTSGAAVTQVAAYQNVDTEQVPPEIRHAMNTGKIHWVTATSNAIVDNLVRQFGASLRNTRLATISPLTSQRIREHGFEVAAEARVATFAGVIDAILGAHTPSAA
ncbi:MAG: uroporphyrinogen-III C-methyltransferase [Planctomycetaceae bacterium]|nr:uroporphyrinogen-III C-methyltransferase [Planctomycetaceae bacterium]